ncbi:MAG: Gfo/Idh/MocA family oxidoreductase [Verrucomicrobia bacterium]|nr:Gfo/Idh/MocA family oxidoreductase [Verrucomicrobiota bacterium]
MAKPVRIGIVGVGSLSLRGLLPHLTQSDLAERVTITALCDPVPNRATAAADRFNIRHVFTDYTELLACDEVDAVTLATPISLHFEQGRQALIAGKHVHFNKTMTTSADDATELITLANQKQLKIVASPGEMLRPHNQRIKEMLREGAIGVLCWAACGAAFGTYHESEKERQGPDVLSNVDPSWYFRIPGGGPLYDMTVYALHALTGILGSVRKVVALSGTRITERSFQGRAVTCDAHDNTVMLLDFGESLFAFAYGTAGGRITYGFNGSYFGTTGSIVGFTYNGLPLDYPGAEIARKVPRPEGVEWQGQIPGNQWLLPHITEAHREIPEQHVFEDIMQLVDWIREDRATIVTAAHARHVIEIIEAAYRANQEGRAQILRTTLENGPAVSSCGSS